MNDVRTAARWARIGLIAALAMVLVGAGLLLFAPDAWRGIDTGMVGGTLLPVGVLAGLIALKAQPTRAESVMSFAEKSAMISLAVTTIAGTYLFMQLRAIGWEQAPDRSSSRAVGVVVTVLIAGGIVSRTLRRKQTGEIEDERDVGIRRRAASHAHTALLALLIVFIIAIGARVPFLRFSSASGVANTLVFVILISEFVRYSMQVWLHRTGR